MGAMGNKVVKTESLKHTQAFEYYYSLGDDRNLGAVAAHLRVTERTVENWSASFNWVERVQQRDIEVATELTRRTVKDIAKTKADYRKIIKVAVAKFLQKLNGDEVSLDKIQDIERLMKLDLLLMGEYTDNLNINGSQTVTHRLPTDADRQAVKTLAESIAKDLSREDDDDADE